MNPGLGSQWKLLCKAASYTWWIVNATLFSPCSGYVATQQSVTLCFFIWYRTPSETHPLDTHTVRPRHLTLVHWYHTLRGVHVDFNYPYHLYLFLYIRSRCMKPCMENKLMIPWNLTLNILFRVQTNHNFLSLLIFLSLICISLAVTHGHSLTLTHT